MRATPVFKDVVLIGGGHAHVHTLRSFAMTPMPGVRVTLIAKDIDTPYSGMLPGFIAGHYTHEQCHIDLQPLSRFANARLIHAEAINIDLPAQRVMCRNRPDIAYDVLSIDIGSTPDLASVSGAARFAIPLKPVDGLARRWHGVLNDFGAQPRPMHFVTVGGGAAGVEIALAIQHHLRALLLARSMSPDLLTFSILTRGALLAGHNAGVQRKMRAVLASRGVRLLENTNVTSVEAGHISCAGGPPVSYDQLIWGTDARAAGWLAHTGLALDEHGFIKIDAQLNALGHSNIFAAGDVASSIDHPRPKAGVFAVRQGPPLTDNIRAVVAGKPAKPFVPQRAFLSLISTGDKSAIASRSWWSASGPWVWNVKDWIDRTWMDKAKSVPDMAAMAPHAAASLQRDDPLGALAETPIRCGGCGAKVGASVLARVLERLSAGAEGAAEVAQNPRDDAAVFAPPPGKMLVQSVDFFRSFIDDPYVFGRIAANHALGDIYAMGATPLSALAIATIPFGIEDKVEDDLYQMLRGGLDVLSEAGATLIGGHSGEGADLALGFSVNGTIDSQHILRKSGSQTGDCLILTKPLGTGTLLAADMRAKARGVWIIEALRAMQQSNAAAARCALSYHATAATDVTGFGLAGHLIEMLQASKCDAVLTLDTIPALSGALDTLAAGMSSSLAPDNLRTRRAIANFEEAATHPAFGLLFDPQTAGGLLISVPAESARRCVADLHDLGYGHASIIGEIVAQQGAEPSITLVTAPPRMHDIRSERAGAD